MEENMSQRWSIGLQFFANKNYSFHRTIDRSPNNVLFGNDPKVGLNSSRLLIDFVQTLNFMTLKTKNRMIKGWHGRDCLKIQERFLTSDEILLEKELTVRKTVTVTTGGHGVSCCSCKSKSQKVCLFKKKNCSLHGKNGFTK
ncbi:Hypothetical protein CINCED_3A017779 [Cinara cedri]|uniref:Uncharacterized protein n=1 Tax=Cinara cedri TaxID=506608 RepID=A0A5E4LXS8_9HEMI|nr:Hypothetical protein CINCED_3A017779 [Cinara cedri]